MTVYLTVLPQPTCVPGRNIPGDMSIKQQGLQAPGTSTHKIRKFITRMASVSGHLIVENVPTTGGGNGPLLVVAPFTWSPIPTYTTHFSADYLVIFLNQKTFSLMFSSTSGVESGRLK